MKKEDIQLIVALEPVEMGVVKIELRPLGYYLKMRKKMKDGNVAHLQDIISYDEAESAILPVALFEYTIQKMVDAMEKLLGAFKITSDKLRSEKFTGY